MFDSNSTAKVAVFSRLTSFWRNNIGSGLALLVIGFFCQACGSDAKGPDVSDIPVKVQILRFDQDLFALDTNNLETGLQQITQKYPVLLPVFTTQMIHDASNPQETPLMALNGFLRATQVRRLNDTVQQVYGNLREMEPALRDLFQHYKYYFPKKPVPAVATIVSEFYTDAFIVEDSLIGVGLDYFLGTNFSGYNPEDFPEYMRRQFNREYIPVRLAKVLAQNVVDAPPARRLLDEILRNGKMLYVTASLLPNTPDSLIMGYTRAQIEGCAANEQTAWARLLELKLLYSSDFNDIRKLIQPSPNAPILFQEAPGEIGNWFGWQIVKSWMKRHPDASMEELLKNQDPQKFLEEAKYKPKKN